MYRTTLILLLCFVLSACASATRPSAATPTLSRTPVSITVTPTGEPSETPEPTEEEFVRPTSTFLAPTPAANIQYRLKQWTPEQANELIEYLQKYPDNLGDTDRGYHDSSYYYAYQWVVLAEQEALFRFPTSSFKERWAWDVSYNMTLYGDSAALESYAKLIGDALQAGTVKIDGLHDWFHQHETRIQLKTTTLPGKRENALIEISDISAGYGGFLWVVKDVAGYLVYPLHGGSDNDRDFGVSSATGVSATLQDLTGDGIPEIITNHEIYPGSVDALSITFDVFDVSHTPPQKLQFSPAVSPLHRPWSFLTEKGRPDKVLGFDFTDNPGSVFCPLEIRQHYRWDGKIFQLTAFQYLHIEPDANDTKVCRNLYTSMLSNELRYGKPETFTAWRKAIANWPYIDDDDTGWFFVNDNKHPDARDEMRFQAGLDLAQSGQVAAARGEMETIIQHPTVPDSAWVAPAKLFLNYFHAPADLPKVCIAIKSCEQFMDVEKLVKMSGASQSSDLIDFLKQAGVSVGQNGLWDVNNDGQEDVWAALTDPNGGDPYFGVFIATASGYSFEYFGTPIKGIPPYEQQPTFHHLPIISVTGRDGETRNFIYTDSGFDQLCRHFSDTFTQLRSDLLNGKAPASILEQISDIVPSLSFACTYNMVEANYLQALAYDLSGDSAQSIENYFTVWHLYPEDPHAYMARARLEVVP